MENSFNSNNEMISRQMDIMRLRNINESRKMALVDTMNKNGVLGNAAEWMKRAANTPLNALSQEPWFKDLNEAQKVMLEEMRTAENAINQLEHCSKTFSGEKYNNIYKQIRGEDVTLDRYLDMTQQLNANTYINANLSKNYNKTNEYLKDYERSQDAWVGTMKFVGTSAAFTGAIATGQWYAIPLAIGGSMGVGMGADALEAGTSTKSFNLKTSAIDNGILTAQHLAFNGASRLVAGKITPQWMTQNTPKFAQKYLIKGENLTWGGKKISSTLSTSAGFTAFGATSQLGNHMAHGTELSLSGLLKESAMGAIVGGGGKFGGAALVAHSGYTDGADSAMQTAALLGMLKLHHKTIENNIKKWGDNKNATKLETQNKEQDKSPKNAGFGLGEWFTSSKTENDTESTIKHESLEQSEAKNEKTDTTNNATELSPPPEKITLNAPAKNSKIAPLTRAFDIEGNYATTTELIEAQKNRLQEKFETDEIKNLKLNETITNIDAQNNIKTTILKTEKTTEINEYDNVNGKLLKTYKKIPQGYQESTYEPDGTVKHIMAFVLSKNISNLILRRDDENGNIVKHFQVTEGGIKPIDSSGKIELRQTQEVTKADIEKIDENTYRIIDSEARSHESGNAEFMDRCHIVSKPVLELHKKIQESLGVKSVEDVQKAVADVKNITNASEENILYAMAKMTQFTSTNSLPEISEHLKAYGVKDIYDGMETTAAKQAIENIKKATNDAEKSDSILRTLAQFADKKVPEQLREEQRLYNIEDFDLATVNNETSINHTFRYFQNKFNLLLEYKGDRTAFLLDKPGIEQLNKLKEKGILEQWQKENNILFVELDGWNSGINLFNYNGNITQPTANMISKAQQLAKTSGMSFKEAFDSVTKLDNPILSDKTITENLHKIDLTKDEQSAKQITEQINPMQMSLLELNTMIKGAGEFIAPTLLSRENIRQQTESKTNEEAHLRKVEKTIEATLIDSLNSQFRVYTPEKLSAELKSMHKKVLSEADSPDNIYYIIPSEHNKSFEWVTHQYAELNGIGKDRILRFNGADAAADTLRNIDAKKATFVILDDFAGTGHSLVNDEFIYKKFREHEQNGDIQVLFAPITMTQTANNFIRSKIDTTQRELQMEAQKNGTTAPTLKDKVIINNEDSLILPHQSEYSAFYKQIAGGTLYGNDLTSVFFPYMGPDNNSAISSLFGQFYVPNSMSLKSSAQLHESYQGELRALQNACGENVHLPVLDQY